MSASGSHIDLAKESAIAGVIAAGESFDKLPDHCLPPIGAFVDARWKLVYRAARALRASGVHVCAESVSDYIVANGLETEFQRAIDSTQTCNWRSWPGPDHCDGSLAFSTRGTIYALEELGRLYREREKARVGQQLSNAEISAEEALKRLQTLLATREGELFVNLKPIIEGGLEPERPSVAKTPTGKALLYAGRLNEIHGEPSVGKTNVALSLARCVIEDGGHVIYIDPEDTPAGILSRLAAMAADVEALEPFIHYLHNPTPADFNRAIAYAEKHGPVLVILDGLAEALAAEGKDENEVGDVLLFFRERLRPFAEAGASVLIADHVTKSTESRGRWARGSGAKLGRYDGVSYSAELIEAYSPEVAGKIRLRVSKDRNGGVGAAGQVAMELHFTPRGDGVTLVEFNEPQEGKPFKPTAIMAKIIAHLEVFPDASKNDLRKLGKHEWVDRAIAELVSEGRIKATQRGQKRTIFELQSVPLKAGAQLQKDFTHCAPTVPLSEI
jgi:hypothetical protein